MRMKSSFRQWVSAMPIWSLPCWGPDAREEFTPIELTPEPHRVTLQVDIDLIDVVASSRSKPTPEP